MRYTIDVVLHQDFVEVDGDIIVVGLMCKPVKCAANRELVRKLAKHFKVSTAQIRIVSGLRSKRKVVEIV